MRVLRGQGAVTERDVFAASSLPTTRATWLHGLVVETQPILCCYLGSNVIHVRSMRKAQKVSISIDQGDLKWLRRRAKMHGGNLSAVFAEATRILRQHEARERLLDRFGADAHVSHEEAERIRAEWQG